MLWSHGRDTRYSTVSISDETCGEKGQGSLRLRLHNVVIRQPLNVKSSTVDRRRMKADRLVVANVSQSLGSRRVPDEHLRIKAPGNDRACNKVVLAVQVDPARHFKELLLSSPSTRC